MGSAKASLLVAASGALALAFASAAGPASEQGFDLSNLDKRCAPCKDFNQFASGGWMARNAIPADRARWGTFDELEERNLRVLREILEEAAKDSSAPKGSNEQKIGDFYTSCMDTERIEREGMRPLLPELDRIEKIHDLETLQAEVFRL